MIANDSRTLYAAADAVRKAETIFFDVFQKVVAGAFDGVEKPLLPLRPLRRGLPCPQSSFLVSRAERRPVLQIFLLFEHFVDFCGQTIQRGWLGLEGRRLLR